MELYEFLDQNLCATPFSDGERPRDRAERCRHGEEPGGIEPAPGAEAAGNVPGQGEMKPAAGYRTARP